MDEATAVYNTLLGLPADWYECEVCKNGLSVESGPHVRPNQIIWNRRYVRPDRAEYCGKPRFHCTICHVEIFDSMSFDAHECKMGWRDTTLGALCPLCGELIIMQSSSWGWTTPQHSCAK